MIVRLAEMAVLGVVIAATAAATATLTDDWAVGVLAGAGISILLGIIQHQTGLTYMWGVDETEAS